jgi:aminoglycoside phosphotransferase family enzyme/predicted kinase
MSSELRDDLRRPEAYPAHTGAAHIDLIETHISWVFLLEHEVFKVKKPVDLGFLDFTTLRQRYLACAAEVSLNRRLAPHVYLGLVPVRVDDGGRACIRGAGRVIDWAVHMQRLPDAIRADQMLAERRLSGADIDRIASRLATFHASCRADPATARFGLPGVLGQNLEENFAQTATLVDQHLSHDQAVELRTWQRAYLREHAAVFEGRAARGRVRDGHGDLRLEHVYLEPARVTVLDCIEFNDRFRYADVCSDVAFLSMDLAAHGRVDLAERLLAAYARETNDFDLYAVVDFYESYRAYVRGKIAAMVAADARMDEPARRRAAREARRYLLLALSADRRSLLSPSVVAVGGTIASGKSTIAARLGAEMGAPVVEADRTRKAMLGVAPLQRVDEPAWTGAYDPAFTDRVYEEVLRRAGVALASGRPVVIDASFRSRSMRDAARRLAASHGVPFRFVECRAPAEVCRARLRLREQRETVSDGRLAIFDDFSARFEPVVEIPGAEHVVLDTSGPADDSAARALRSVDSWPPGLCG